MNAYLTRGFFRLPACLILLAAAGCAPALHDAVEKSDITKVQRLLEKGADPDARDGDGMTPLMHAVKDDKKAYIVKKLIEHGADVNAKDAIGRTPLKFAVFEGAIKIVRILIKNGADVKSRDDDGWTPLMLAAKQGEVDIALILIEHGADVNAKDRLGRSVLNHALTENIVDVGHFFGDMLVKNGVSFPTERALLLRCGLYYVITLDGKLQPDDSMEMDLAPGPHKVSVLLKGEEKRGAIEIDFQAEEGLVYTLYNEVLPEGKWRAWVEAFPD